MPPPQLNQEEFEKPEEIQTSEPTLEEEESKRRLEQMAEAEKTQAGHRFRLSEEEFAKERLEHLKQGFDKLKTEDDAVLSLCMFGSFVKGNVKPESDIDGYVFVDADKLLARAKANASDPEKIEPVYENSSNKSTETYLTEKLWLEYKDKVNKDLGESGVLSTEQLNGIKVRPVNEEILSHQINGLAEYHKELEEFNKKRTEYVEGKSEEHPEKPEFIGISSTLVGMFHLDMGGGIRKYRKSVIDKLSSIGEEGEKIWGEIVEGVEMQEQYYQTNTDKRYPRTLLEAQKIYG